MSDSLIRTTAQLQRITDLGVEQPNALKVVTALVSDVDRGSLIRYVERPENMVEYVEQKELEMVASVEVPPEFMLQGKYAAATRSAMRKGRVITGVAPTLMLRDRKRSGYARRMLERAVRVGPSIKGEVEAGTNAKAYVSGGTQYTLGRLARFLPAKGWAPDPVVVANTAWWDQSMRFAGYQPVGFYNRKEPLGLINPGTDMSDGGYIRVDTKSNSGSPCFSTAGNLESLATELKLATFVRNFVTKAQPANILDRIRELEKSYPYLALFVGAAKADMYTLESMRGNMLRFYNACPAPLKYTMMQATQVVDEHTFNIVNSNFSKSSKGVRLMDGGAAAILQKLESEVQREGYAWCNDGDDTYICIQVFVGGAEYYLHFSLDCSSFDLTQDEELRAPAIRRLAELVKAVDLVSGSIFEYTHKSRLVALLGTYTVRMRDGGPSGLMMQSGLNSIIMNFFLQAYFDRLKRVAFDGLVFRFDSVDSVREVLEVTCKVVGRSLGLVVKFADYKIAPVSSLWDLLKLEPPMLYVGYEWKVEVDTEGQECLKLFQQLPRSCSNVLYPARSWTPDDKVFQVDEALRMAGWLVCLGMPFTKYEEYYDSLVSSVVGLLDSAETLVLSGVRPTHNLLDSWSPYLVGLLPSTLSEDSALAMVRSLRTIVSEVDTRRRFCQLRVVDAPEGVGIDTIPSAPKKHNPNLLNLLPDGFVVPRASVVPFSVGRFGKPPAPPGLKKAALREHDVKISKQMQRNGRRARAADAVEADGGGVILDEDSGSGSEVDDSYYYSSSDDEDLTKFEARMNEWEERRSELDSYVSGSVASSEGTIESGEAAVDSNLGVVVTQHKVLRHRK